MTTETEITQIKFYYKVPSDSLTWGPVLIPDKTDSVTILGRYEKGKKEPAILAFDYGLGRVFIIGTHPEFEEDSDRDGTDFADKFDDKGSDWGLMKKAVLWCLKE